MVSKPEHILCPYLYVSMLVLVYYYARNIFDAHVPIFLCLCPYISIREQILCPVSLCFYVQNFFMLMFIYFYARARIFLCLKIFHDHVPMFPHTRACMFLLVSVCFYARTYFMLVSRCFYAHVRMFQCTSPYISTLEHNLCLCP